LRFGLLPFGFLLLLFAATGEAGRVFLWEGFPNPDPFWLHPSRLGKRSHDRIK
jgi:hypothetical protein